MLSLLLLIACCGAAARRVLETPEVLAKQLPGDSHGVPQVAVLRGQDLHLHAPETHGSWFRTRLWDPTKSDRLSVKSNCSFQSALKDRLVRCDTNFTLLRLDYQDAGIYWIYQDAGIWWLDPNYRGPEAFAVYVHVFRSQPVLAPIGLHNDRLDVQCFDLFNPQASFQIEVKGDYSHHPKNAPSVQPVASHNNSWSVFIPKPRGIWQRYYRGWIRCVARFHQAITYTSWRSVQHAAFLHTHSAPSRPWCSVRGLGRTKQLSYDYSHQGALVRGKCLRRYFSASDPVVMPCEGSFTSIYTVATGKEFKYQKPLGGQRVVARGPLYQLTPRLNSTGNYVVVAKTQPHQVIRSFKMEVQPALYASIDLLEQKNEEIFLNCSHSGDPEKSVVIWEVEGVYGSFQSFLTQPYQALLRHDCWKNWYEWHYKVAVRCTVIDPHSQVTSRWFLAKGKHCRNWGCNAYTIMG